jgi:carbon storage regulator
MLVLTRRTGEEVVIGEHIRVRVTLVQGNRVRLGIIAPENVRVARAEVHECRMPHSAEAPALEHCTSIASANSGSYATHKDGSGSYRAIPGFPKTSASPSPERGNRV